jgi:hypothetical protein
VWMSLEKAQRTSSGADFIIEKILSTFFTPVKVDSSV